MAEKIAYDEFAMFHENAEEYGIPYTPPAVRREGVDLGDGRRLSALVWGSAPPDLVFLHGGAQNAHTWDTVLLALGRPAVAVDLPGHGHSDGGRSGYLDPDDNAENCSGVMSYPPNAFGKPAIALMAGGFLDSITPGVNGEKSAQITAFVNGPESFPDFDAILARTVEFNPTRSVASLRRGILHNAEQRDDGSWVWRYARHRSGVGEAPGGDPHDRFKQLWDALGSVTVPVMLVRGMRPQSVVDDADEAELRRRQPDVRVEHVEEAGHSVQGDTPVELAALIADFVG